MQLAASGLAKIFATACLFVFEKKTRYFCGTQAVLPKEGTRTSPLFILDMKEKEHIAALAEKMLADEAGVFLVDVLLNGKGNNLKVQVLIDGDQGVTIEQCAELSRQLSAQLEEEELFEGAWRLEVSSPGVDYPLRWPRQYKKHVGRRLQLQRTDDRQLEGKLEDVSESGIVLLAETKEKKKVHTEAVHVPFDDIKKTIVLVSFK